MTENELSHEIIGAAIEVHKCLGGPGLLEEHYEEAFCYELQLRGLQVDRQVCVPVIYKGKSLSKTYRLDLLVNGLVVVECKAVEKVLDVHRAQCLTQLRITNKRLGLVVNFGERFVKDGVHRIVNDLKE
ncbi:MAG: GxxExxY protein [Planctomycetota bacterium]|jgi:GxxExxY protein